MKKLLLYIITNNYDRHIFFGMLISKLVLLLDFEGVSLFFKILILGFVNLCVGILWEWTEEHYFNATISKADIVCTILGLFLALYL